MSLIRGVLLAGQFRSQHDLDTMSDDDQRSTLIAEMAGRSKQVDLLSFNDETLAGMGAVLVFLRTARIRDDAGLKGMTADDMRNTLIVELAAQTKMSIPALQGMGNMDLVLLGLGQSQPGALTRGSFIRGVLLAGQFRTQGGLDTMSPEDQRNTLIVEMAAHSSGKVPSFQALNDFDLAGAGAVMVFLRGARIRSDAELKTMSIDDQRNTAIVELDAQTQNGVPVLQGMTSMNLVLAALGVDFDKCDPLRTELAAAQVELRNTKQFDPPSEPGGHPTTSEAFRAASARVSRATVRLNACVASLPHLPPPPPTPVPLTLTLTDFVCLDQSDEIRLPPLFLNTEDDEPYALVFAVDLKTGIATLPAGATNSKMTLVGPLSDVDLEERSAPPNVIWGLSDVPDLVSAASNLIVLVAMMENDNGSPDQARTVLQAAAQASMAQNLPAFVAKQIPRQELVTRIASGMTGAMGLATVGIPNPDDHIGPIQELPFFQFELDGIYKSSRLVEKSLDDL